MRISGELSVESGGCLALHLAWVKSGMGNGYGHTVG